MLSAYSLAYVLGWPIVLTSLIKDKRRLIERVTNRKIEHRISLPADVTQEIAKEFNDAMEDVRRDSARKQVQSEQAAEIIVG